jgi:hypothetical protein
MKTTWTFFGKVRPERFPVSWGPDIKGDMVVEELNLEADFSVSIHAAQIVVTLAPTKGTADLDTLRNIALNHVYQLVDIVGYASGCYFDVEIISAYCADTRQTHVFGIEIPALVSRQNPYRGTGQIDGELVVAVSKNIPAQMVLRDFQLAMRDAIGTGFYCYRGIEAMMQAMKNDTTRTDKQAWEKLNRSLRLDRSASEKIKNYADHPRHGKRWAMRDEDRVEVFRLTDEIVYRYLEYLRRDAGELPATEFAVLDAQSIV